MCHHQTCRSSSLHLLPLAWCPPHSHQMACCSGRLTHLAPVFTTVRLPHSCVTHTHTHWSERLPHQHAVPPAPCGCSLTLPCPAALKSPHIEACGSLTSGQPYVAFKPLLAELSLELTAEKAFSSRTRRPPAPCGHTHTPSRAAASAGCPAVGAPPHPALPSLPAWLAACACRHQTA